MTRGQLIARLTFVVAITFAVTVESVRVDGLRDRIAALEKAQTAETETPQAGWYPPPASDPYWQKPFGDRMRILQQKDPGAWMRLVTTPPSTESPAVAEVPLPVKISEGWTYTPGHRTTVTVPTYGVPFVGRPPLRPNTFTFGVPIRRTVPCYCPPGTKPSGRLQPTPDPRYTPAQPDFVSLP